MRATGKWCQATGGGKAVGIRPLYKYYSQSPAVPILKLFFKIFTKTEGFRATKCASVPIDLTIAVILNPILTYLRPSQAELCISLSRLRAIPFFAIYAKTESFRASEPPCVPTNSIIAVILNPILRYLRPSQAEISFMATRLSKT